MATREALHDLRTLQASCWRRQATLTKIEAQLPLMTTVERSAMADELLAFARAALNGCQGIAHRSILLAETAQQQQALAEEIQRALRPRTP
jgi:hypothetical protein